MCEGRRSNGKEGKPKGLRKKDDDKKLFLTDLTGENDGALTEQCEIHVQQIAQLYEWDCGLACVRMCLSVLLDQAPSLQTLVALCRTTSVWTIDLAHILRSYSMRVIVTTTCVGANPSYKSAAFYASQIDGDIDRVNRLFSMAETAGISVIKTSISPAQLKRILLSGRYLAICLVDKAKLLYNDSAGNTQYTGHYILLHGFDSTTDSFYYKDPALYRNAGSYTGRLSSLVLDMARQSYGTDEDLIFVSISHCPSS
jgi:Guanylylate cyclase